MNRRGFIRNIPILSACFLGGRELDNCGIKVTRREDGGIVIDGSKCELRKPKQGFSEEHGNNAIILKDFTLKNERQGHYRIL